MQWFKDGDRNSKFFHAYVKGRRKKLLIQKIENKQGVTLDKSQEIGEEAVRVFQEQFRENGGPDDYHMLGHIPRLITEEENNYMTEVPSSDEIK